MPEALARVHPLAALAATSPSSDAVALAPVPPAARLSVRAGEEARAALGEALGVSPPTEPCRAAVAEQRAALWLGPDEWLVLAPDGSAADLLAVAAGAGAVASVVDISHRNSALTVSGPHAADALNGFCALDLDSAAFPVGMCTRTLLGKAEIVLWRTGAEEFRVEVARSFATYVWGCLEEARREFLD
jgi:heterotetrameric sarcosine oxidase gamma subunit